MDMGELDPGSRYRLHISLDGLEYESDYLGPEITPPIDSISLLKKGPGEEVRLCVSTRIMPRIDPLISAGCIRRIGR